MGLRPLPLDVVPEPRNGYVEATTQRTARPGRGHLEAPAPANHPHQPRKPPPATFKITPWRPCALPSDTNAPVRLHAACGGRGEKLVLSPSRSVTFAYLSPVRIPALGRHFNVLRTPSLQTLKPTRRTLKATRERSRDHPKPAAHREVGVQTGQSQHSGTLSGKALLSSGLQPSGAGPRSSRPPPHQLQALQAGAETPSVSSSKPSVPPEAGPVQPPGGPLPSADVLAVPCSSLPGKSTGGKQPADPRASPPGPLVGTKVTGKKPPGGPSGSASPRSAGRRPCRTLPGETTEGKQPADPRACPPGPLVGTKVTGKKPPGGPSGSASPRSAGRRPCSSLPGETTGGKQPADPQASPPGPLVITKVTGKKPPGGPSGSASPRSAGRQPCSSLPGETTGGKQPADPRASPPGPLVGTKVTGKKPPGGPSGSTSPGSAGRRPCKRKHPLPHTPQLAPLQLPLQWGRGEFPPPPKLPSLATTNLQATNNTQVPTNNIPPRGV
ncbi:basic salivary proline-rich protein 2-like [Sorex araneus]|uniref:basic salivary proline-rich protein 2-like n=1 Tax=Sorex araneus TaxID=42254 RepID=UPI0024334475|nr:basic salivary proline-rich protein 2-like [Sorex araneus]